MANDQIKKSDLFENDLFGDVKKGATDTIEKIDELVKSFTELTVATRNLQATTNVNTSEDIKKITKAETELAKQKKILVQLEIESQKLKQQQLKTDSQVVKNISQETKVLKDEQKAKDAETKARQKNEAQIKKEQSAYAQLSKQLNESRARTKDLLALQAQGVKLSEDQQKELTNLVAETQRLDKTLKDIDATTGQFNRNVGNYKDGLVNAIKESGVFGQATEALEKGFQKLRSAFGFTIAELKKHTQAFKDNKKEIEENAKGQGILAQATAKSKIAFGGATTAVKLFGTVLKASGIGLIVALVGSLVVAFTKTQEGADDASVFIEGLKASFEELLGSIGRFGIGVFKVFQGLFEALSEFKISFSLEKGLDVSFGKAKEIFNQAGDEFEKAFSGLGERLSTAFQEGLQLGRTILKFREESLQLRRELIDIDDQLAISQQKAADATLDFETRLKNQLVVMQKQIEISSINIKLAKNEVEIAQARLRMAEKAGVKNVELREKELEALTKLSEAENELAVNRLNQQQALRQIELDRLQNELQILEKQFDKISAVKEKEFNDDQVIINKKIDNLKELSAQSQLTFDEEIKRIAETTKKNIDGNDLVNTSDERLLLEKIRRLKLGDQAEGLLNKAILLRQQQIATETSLTLQLNKALEAKARAIQAVNVEISNENVERQLIDLERLSKANDKAFGKSDLLTNLQKLNDDFNRITNEQARIRRNQLIDNAAAATQIAEQTIVEEDLRAKEIEKINAKLNNDLKKLENDRVDQVAENNKKIREARIKNITEVANKVLDEIQKEIDREFQLRQKGYDDAIKQRESNIDIQKRLAEKGLTNELAFQEAQKAKLELAKKQAQEREIRQLQAVAFAKSYVAYLDSTKDPQKAITNAIRDAVLVKLIQGAFYEGTENVGESLGKPVLPGKDGHIVRVDGSERIMTGEQNKAVGDMSNEDLAMLAKSYHSGTYLPAYMMESNTGSTAKNLGNSAMLHQLYAVNNRLKSLEQAIVNKREVHTNIDQVGNVITRDIENGFTTVRKKLRAKPKL